MANKSTSHVAISARSFELVGKTAPTELRLIPAGLFRSLDTRPEGVAGWYLDDANAAAIVATAAARQNRYVIDYEHQTLAAAKNGKPAPASAWFKTLEWRPGDGLYATDVEWTANAAQMIEAKEYRYLSPVFAWNDKTGAVLAIAHAALTNTPGLDDLTDLSALSLSFASLSEEDQMDELLERVTYLFNLPVGTTGPEAAAHLKKVGDQLAGMQQGAAASLKTDLSALLTAQHAELSALKLEAGKAPDPAQFIPVAALTALQGELSTATSELAALKAEASKSEVTTIVNEALSSGKLTPALVPWATDLGISNLASLKSHLAAATPGLVPGKTQTDGKAPEKVAGSTDPSAIAHAALRYQTEQSNAGISVSTVEAVAHVIKGA